MGGRGPLKILLDTHALIWWATGTRALSAKARRAIADEGNDVYVSAASAWEIATKVRIGKLVWPEAAGTVHAYVMSQGFLGLDISIEDAERAGHWAHPHRDPFDRMLMAQAQGRGLLFVSNEALFDAAGVRRYW